jgi:hypothetical protein
MLASGESSNRRIATQCGVSEAAIRRHKAEHMPAALAKAQDAAEVAQADDLLAKVRALEADASRIRDKAEGEGDYRAALQGVRELTRIVELMAKLLGALDNQQHILVRQQVQVVQAIVLDPEATRMACALLDRVSTDPPPSSVVSEPSDSYGLAAPAIENIGEFGEAGAS